MALRALKKAEDGTGYVIRLYELDGREAKDVSVGFPTDIIEALEKSGEPKGTAVKRLIRMGLDKQANK